MSQGLALPQVPIFSRLDIAGTTASIDFKTVNWTAGESNNNYRISEIGDDNPYFQIQKNGYFVFHSKSSEENEGSVVYPVKLEGDTVSQRVGIDFNNQGQVWTENNNFSFQSNGSINLYLPVGQTCYYYVGSDQKLLISNNTTNILNRLLIGGAVDNTTDALQVNGAVKSNIIKLAEITVEPPPVKGGIYFNGTQFKACRDGNSWNNI